MIQELLEGFIYHGGWFILVSIIVLGVLAYYFFKYLWSFK